MEKDHNLSIQKIKCDTVVKKTFGTCISCSKGIFQISAKPETLDFLYKSGVGSRRSEGFGMFDVIMEVT